MNHLVWSLRRFVAQIGVAGSVGLILLLGLAAAHRYVVMPAQARVVLTQNTTLSLAARLAQQKLQPKVVGPEEQLNQFHKGLPEASAGVMADVLTRLHALANAESLILEQGDYRLSSESTEPLARFDIVFPARGGYPQLRSFLARALREESALALNTVSFSRPAIGDAVVDAQLRFTLYMRRP